MTPDTDHPDNVFAAKPAYDNLNDDIAIIKNDWRAWMAAQPQWFHIIAVIACALFGFLFRHHTAPAPAPQPVSLTVHTTTASAPAPVLVGAEPKHIHPFHRAGGEHFRKLAAKQLEREGFAAVGGDKTPLTAEQAAKVLEKVSDTQIHAAGHAVGVWDAVAPGGGILEFFRRLIEWAEAHPELVQAIIKLLLSLAMLA